MFNGIAAIVQSLFRNDGSQLIHGITKRVSDGMNHTAGLTHRMTPGNVGRIGQFLCHSMAV